MFNFHEQHVAHVPAVVHPPAPATFMRTASHPPPPPPHGSKLPDEGKPVDVEASTLSSAGPIRG